MLLPMNDLTFDLRLSHDRFRHALASIRHINGK